MVGSEAAPFSKTGGLADVLGALPAALVRRGEKVAVVLPRYRGAHLDGARRVYYDLPVWLGPQCFRVAIYEAIHRDVSYYFVNCPPLFDRDGIYNDAGLDYPDNHIRFAVLSRAAIGVMRDIFRPDVVHCHDWPAALVAPYLRYTFAGDPTFFSVKTLFTIHNLGYQGIFPRRAIGEVGLDDSLFRPDLFEFYGSACLLKGGIVLSDAVSTVSPTYAREIQTPECGFGLDGLLRTRSGVLCGILNGVDYSEWSPETDCYIAAHYSAGDLGGKRICRKALIEELGLASDSPESPLIGIISRFAHQKGFDLVEEIAGELARMDVQFAVLGSGDARFEELFRSLAQAHPRRFGVRIGYDNALAHRIEAGADLFLMPSRYEPCGLSQIYSLRYGTVPIVRATGGLDDTIDESTGFKFREYSGQALLGALRAALDAYRGPQWTAMLRNGMARDFSWDVSAAEYSALYGRLAPEAG